MSLTRTSRDTLHEFRLGSLDALLELLRLASSARILVIQPISQRRLTLTRIFVRIPFSRQGSIDLRRILRLHFMGVRV